MAEKSRVISRANITNLYISTVGYDSTIQTEVDICGEPSIDMMYSSNESLTIRSLNGEREAVDSSISSGLCCHFNCVHCLFSQFRDCGHS